jgi:hypothetical protein
MERVEFPEAAQIDVTNRPYTLALAVPIVRFGTEVPAHK